CVSRAPASPAIYTLSLHDALPISRRSPTPASTPPGSTAPTCPRPRSTVPAWPRRTPSCSTTRRRPPGRPGAPTAGERAECPVRRSEEHTSELQSRENLVCRLLLEK